MEVGRVDKKEGGWQGVDGNGKGETGRGKLEGGNGEGEMWRGAIGMGREWQWGGGQCEEEMERGAAPINNVILMGEVKAYFRLNFHIIHVHFKQ